MSDLVDVIGVIESPIVSVIDGVFDSVDDGVNVRRSFYRDILFPHSLPYRDILLVYLKENCALLALLAFFPKQRKCQVSCHVSQSMRLISQIIYLNQIIIIFILIDRNQSSSSSCSI